MKYSIINIIKFLIIFNTIINIIKQGVNKYIFIYINKNIKFKTNLIYNIYSKSMFNKC